MFQKFAILSAIVRFVFIEAGDVVYDFAHDSSFSFVSIGDWGGAALDGGQATNSKEYQNVMAVAKQMSRSAATLDAKFVINTGDNFYWCGIQNTSDFQIEADFIQPYSGSKSLQKRWYSVLGNHEYGYNVTAQIDFTSLNDYWYLPKRYYTERITMDEKKNAYASMIFLDTSPCLWDYRNEDPKHWDPCSTQYPTCSLGTSDDDFEGECEFHNNILTQDCYEQYNWLKNTLNDVPENDWLIVVGHHPIDELDVEDFTSLLQNRGFSIYINGHAHALTQYTIDYAGAYVTTGAGSLVDTVDQTHWRTNRKVNGLNIDASGEIGEASHSYQTVFNQKVAGFTSHTFDADFTKLITNFVSYTGENLHSFIVTKSGEIVE